jgi:succinylglutamate desuccinylase
MPARSDLQKHIDEFLDLKSTFSKFNSYEELDTYAFKCHFQDGQTQLMLFGLTHGDEIVGLPIINQVLRNLLESKKYNFAVMLNNIEAYWQQKRCVEFDLNRSFSDTLSNIRNQTYEYQRALLIKSVINKIKPQFILDLHQTIEDSVCAFAVSPEQKDLIHLAKNISPDTPILSFKKTGFSNIGMTLIEYANSLNIPALVFEIGQKGFNQELTLDFSKKIMKFIENISLNRGFFSDKSIDYYLIVEEIPFSNEQVLIEGFKSFESLEPNQKITLNKANKPTEIFVNKHENAVMIFPRYSQAKPDEELGLIAVKRNTDTLS